MEERKIFSNDSLELSTLCNKGKSSNTSFLIPIRQMRQLTISMNLHRSFADRINSLLEASSHLIYFGLVPEKRWKVTCSYQDQGLELQKISCRIFDETIIELDVMARSLGISRCRLFVLFLELEAIGWLRLVRALGLVGRTTFSNFQVFSLYNKTILEVQILETLKFSSS